MERSGNFYKAIQLGYILISILIGCMAYNSLYEWQEIEALELGNKKIDELRKEINNINIQMIKFSLLGETILEWNDKDIEHYHARRMPWSSSTPVSGKVQPPKPTARPQLPITHPFLRRTCHRTGRKTFRSDIFRKTVTDVVFTNCSNLGD